MEAFVTANFCCPITHRLMRDPVTTRHGISYEREALIRAWKNNGGIDPVTKGRLRYDPRKPDREISTNHALRRAIQHFDPSLPPYSPPRPTVVRSSSSSDDNL